MDDLAPTGDAAATAAPLQDAIRWLDGYTRLDAAEVGGKAAGLGELSRAGFRVPPGFVVTVGAPRLDPAAFRDALSAALVGLGARSVAVRSSGVGEDSASASHAGLLVSVTDVDTTDGVDTADGDGVGAVLDAMRTVWQSAESDEVTAYRAAVGGHRRAAGSPMAAETGHDPVAVAVVVQKMVHGEYSGVAFSSDPVSGQADTMLVEVIRGPGAGLVGGTVEPYRFRLSSDGSGPPQMSQGGPGPVGPGSEPVPQVARLVSEVADHFGMPVDIEWCWDRGILHVVQVRPITFTAAALHPDPNESRGGEAGERSTVGRVLVHGEPASPGVARGIARVLDDLDDIGSVVDGDVLVTRFTSPDWMPALLRASALVTEVGGVTSHAAIVSRELRIPCVVGADGARSALRGESRIVVDGSAGTVSAGFSEG